ncbi:MAG: hypothetical protein LBJ76_00195 [Candidatus Accumulibacter sp.]|nr:hypothetical protein [Accumulibacter sp.]
MHYKFSGQQNEGFPCSFNGPCYAHLAKYAMGSVHQFLPPPAFEAPIHGYSCYARLVEYDTIERSAHCLPVVFLCFCASVAIKALFFSAASMAGRSSESSDFYFIAGQR